MTIVDFIYAAVAASALTISTLSVLDGSLQSVAEPYLDNARTINVEGPR